MKRNPGYLGYIEGYTTQFCGDYNRPLLRIPITQPVFHEKYGRAFLVAHLVLAGLFTMRKVWFWGVWDGYGEEFDLPTLGECRSRQFVATKPPRSPQMVV